jgi:hypothetical protein
MGRILQALPQAILQVPGRARPGGTRRELVRRRRLPVGVSQRLAAPATRGVGLGFRPLRMFQPMAFYSCPMQWTRFRQRIRELEAQYMCGMMGEETLARSVASMIGHVRHVNSLAARRSYFARSLFLG